MAKKAKKKKVMYTTPVGTFIYPHLTRPDQYLGKEQYKCQFRLPKEEARPLVDLMEEAATKQNVVDVAMNGGDPVEYAEEYRAYKILDDGVVEFTAKLNRYGNKGKPEEFEQRVAVFDAANHPITDPTVSFWSGSTGRINVEVSPWVNDTGTRGVSLRLWGAQIIEAAERGEREADTFGFTAVEGGFDVNAVDEDEDTETFERKEY